MTSINLENYLYNDAVIQLRSGETRTGRLEYSKEGDNPNTKYIFKTSVCTVSHYNKFGEAFCSDGTRAEVARKYDIVEIKMIGESKTEFNADMSKAIASAVKIGALHYVQTNNKFADVVANLLEEYIHKTLGNVNKNVKGDVIQAILDSMTLS